MVVAWGAAGVAFLLLVASLAGDGMGLMGVALLRPMSWSYALVGIALVVAALAARPRPVAA